jgi:cell division protease FtsH
MATKWGLSDKLGPVTYGEDEDEVFLGRSVTQHKNVSNETARKIDEVVREILDTAYARTKRLLTDNIDKLHVMAEALLQYETIDAHQIDDIMAGRVPGPPADWEKSAPSGSTPPPPPPRGDAGAKVGDPATQSHL